jgi:hypothetical protein
LPTIWLSLSWLVFRSTLLIISTRYLRPASMLLAANQLLWLDRRDLRGLPLVDIPWRLPQKSPAAASWLVATGH